MAPYRGRRTQRGHGLGAIFKNLIRAAVPTVKTVGKSVGRELLKKGAKAGVAIASDALAGRDVKTAAKRRISKAAVQVLRRGIKRIGPPTEVSRRPTVKRARRTHTKRSRNIKRTGRSDIFTT